MTEIIIMVVARNLRQRRKKAGLTSRLFCACLSPPSAVPVKMPC